MILDSTGKSIEVNISTTGTASETLLDLQGSCVVDPHDLYALFEGSTIFCWDRRDDTAPHVGPTLSIRGNPSAVASPHILADNTRLNCELYGADQGRYSTATGINPSSDSADFVIGLNILGSGPGSLAGGEFIFSNYDANVNVGWVVYVPQNLCQLNLYYAAVGGLFDALPIGGYVPNSMNSLVIMVNRDGNIVASLNKEISVLGAMKAGSLTTTCTSLSCNARTTGTSFCGGIESAMMWSGTGIFESWAADSYLMAQEWIDLSCGVFSERGMGTHNRSSYASWVSGRPGESNRRYFLAGLGYPRAGDLGLLRTGPETENEVYNNLNPTVTTGWTKVGDGAATLTVVDDATELATVHMLDGDTVDGTCWGPNVFKLDNSGGATAAYAYGGAATGDTDERCHQCIARSTSPGTSPAMGSYDLSAGTFVDLSGIVKNSTYHQMMDSGYEPSDTDEYFAIYAPAGVIVWFIAAQREKGFVCTSIVPNTATAATATREQDVITSNVDVIDTNGQIAATVIPLNWSYETPHDDCLIITTESDDQLLRFGASGWESDDGTNTVGVPYESAAWEILAILVRWFEANQALDVEGVNDTEPYVGARLGGAIKIAPTISEQSVGLIFSTIGTEQSPYYVAWIDHESDTVEQPESDVGNIPGNVDLAIVPAPAASHSRQVTLLNIYCAEPAGNSDVIVKLVDGGTDYILYHTTLDYQETLSWSAHYGWVVTNAEGDIRTSSLLPGYDPQAKAYKVFQVNKDLGRSDILVNFTTVGAWSFDGYVPDEGGMAMVPAGYENLSLTIDLVAASGKEIDVWVESTNDNFIDPADCTWVQIYGFVPNVGLDGDYWINMVSAVSESLSLQWDFDGIRSNRVRVGIDGDGTGGTVVITATRS